MKDSKWLKWQQRHLVFTHSCCQRSVVCNRQTLPTISPLILFITGPRVAHQILFPRVTVAITTPLPSQLKMPTIGHHRGVTSWGLEEFLEDAGGPQSSQPCRKIIITKRPLRLKNKNDNFSIFEQCEGKECLVLPHTVRFSGKCVTVRARLFMLHGLTHFLLFTVPMSSAVCTSETIQNYAEQ